MNAPPLELLVSVRGEDGSAVAGATVFVDRRAPKGFEGFLYDFGTDKRFDVVAGEYEVRCDAANFAPSGRTIVKIDRDSTQRLNITLQRGLAYRIQVVDQDRRGVEGAVVSVRTGNSWGSAKTNRFGRCLIGGIKLASRGSAFFGVKAAGFAPYSNSMQFPDSEGEESVRLELRRGARVVFRFRGVDGAPLRGQQIHIFYAPREPPTLGHQLWKKTDDKGEIVFPALEKGTARVQVRELEKHSRKIELTGQAQEILIDLSPGDSELAGTILMPDGSLLTLGKVWFLPISRAKKGPGNATRAPVGRDGSFRITGLESGEGSLWVLAPGFAAQHTAVSVPSASVQLWLREEFGVAGIVVTRAGDPVPAVPVWLEREFNGWSVVGSVTTDAHGRFTFRGVPDGPKLQLRVRNNKKWIESYGAGYAFTPGDMSVRLTVKPESDGPGLKIPIEAVDDRGRPLKGRWLQLQHTRDGKRGRWGELSARATETPGRFVLHYFDLPGTWDIRFSMTGYLPVDKPGIVIADAATQPLLRVVFERGATLTVIARNADGSPLANTTLYCERALVRTDANGRVQFSGFPRGSRRVVIYKHGDYWVHSGGIDADLPGRVEVVLARRAHVVGRATGKGPFHWKLVDVDGGVRDECTTNKMRLLLYTPIAGPHRLFLRQGDVTTEYEVTAKLGESVSVGPK